MKEQVYAIRKIEAEMHSNFKAATLHGNGCTATGVIDCDVFYALLHNKRMDDARRHIAGFTAEQLQQAAQEFAAYLGCDPARILAQMQQLVNPQQQPTPEPAAGLPTAAEIEDIAADEAQLLEKQIANEQDADDRALLVRERNAMNKATMLYAEGIRIREGARGDLLIHSATDSTVYRVARHGGVFSCGCKAHEKGQPCWHVALAQLVDQARAVRDAGYGDDAPDAEPTRVEIDPALRQVFAAWQARVAA